jgi:hypothetical protein
MKQTITLTADQLKTDYPKVSEDNSEKLYAISKRGGGTIRIKHDGRYLDVSVKALEE